MLFWVVFIFCLILILALLLFIRVKIVLDYSLDGLDDDISIRFYALKGFLKYDYRLPVKKKKSEETEKRSRIDALSDKIKNFREVIRTIIKIKVLLAEKLILREYRLNIVFGAGDVFYTAILSGVLWAAAGTLTAYAVNSFRTQKKNVNIKSVFNEYKFKVELHCIFSIKIVHIIVVALKLYFDNKKKKLNKQKNKKDRR